jgi:hypothetical protein
MKMSLPLPENKKLSVIYRVEPGCLGPEGESHIVMFCKFAQSALKTLDSHYIAWNIVARNDKKLPEMEYNLAGKKMNHTQSEKYLAVFNKSLDEFEGHLSDKLTILIDQFMGY